MGAYFPIRLHEAALHLQVDGRQAQVIVMFLKNSSRACRKLWRRPQNGPWRPSFHTLLTCGRPKQSATSRFCSHTVQAPAKPTPLRSHSMALYGASDVKRFRPRWLST